VRQPGTSDGDIWGTWKYFHSVALESVATLTSPALDRAPMFAILVKGSTTSLCEALCGWRLRVERGQAGRPDPSSHLRDRVRTARPCRKSLRLKDSVLTTGSVGISYSPAERLHVASGLARLLRAREITTYNYTASLPALRRRVMGESTLRHRKPPRDEPHRRRKRGTSLLTCW